MGQAGGCLVRMCLPSYHPYMGQAGGCLVRMCVSFCLRFSLLKAIFVCFFSCRRA